MAKKRTVRKVQRTITIHPELLKVFEQVAPGGNVSQYLCEAGVFRVLENLHELDPMLKARLLKLGYIQSENL